eukprot:2593534-Pyramimonas_sp.AAC.1
MPRTQRQGISDRDRPAWQTGTRTKSECEDKSAGPKGNRWQAKRPSLETQIERAKRRTCGAAALSRCGRRRGRSPPATLRASELDTARASPPRG